MMKRLIFIALEEKVIQDTSQIIKWDGHEWPVKSWNQEQTLKTAMEYSCVWVYVGFAEKIGIDKYYQFVDAFNYSNKTWQPVFFRAELQDEGLWKTEFCPVRNNEKYPARTESDRVESGRELSLNN